MMWETISLAVNIRTTFPFSVNFKAFKMAILSDNFKSAALMMGSMAGFVISDTFLKLAGDDMGFYQVIAVRGLMATALLAAFAAWRGGLFYIPAKKDMGMILVRSATEIGATICFLSALYHMPLANITAIMQSLPLSITLAAAVFMREPVGWRRYLAIFVGFAGVLLIVRPGAGGFEIYALYAVGAVAFVTLRDLVTRQLSSQVPSTFVAFFTTAVVMLMGFAMMSGEAWQPISQLEITYLAGSALALMGGYQFAIMTMRLGEVSFVAPFRYTSMLWAIPLSLFVFGDQPDIWMLAGSIIVVASGVYTFMREHKLSK